MMIMEWSPCDHSVPMMKDPSTPVKLASFSQYPRGCVELSTGFFTPFSAATQNCYPALMCLTALRCCSALLSSAAIQLSRSSRLSRRVTSILPRLTMEFTYNITYSPLQ